ncbi:hypothetical protein GCM10010236_45200 [Streptomyces eurythermus]|nr:hypothetical protein GCM10010236_45200 [Streptomyces eurythermus]
MRGVGRAGRPAAEALPHLLRRLADPVMRHPHGPALLAPARSGAPEAEAIVVEHFEHQRSFVADRYRDEAREALRVLRRVGAPYRRPRYAYKGAVRGVARPRPGWAWVRRSRRPRASADRRR